MSDYGDVDGIGLIRESTPHRDYRDASRVVKRWRYQAGVAVQWSGASEGGPAVHIRANKGVNWRIWREAIDSALCGVMTQDLGLS